MKGIKNISIIGAGAWGTGIAKIIADSFPGSTVKIWCYEKALSLELNSKRVNNSYLPGVKLPSNIFATSNVVKSVEKADCVFFAMPPNALDGFLNKLEGKFNPETLLVSGVGGFIKKNSEILTPCTYLENFTDRVENIVSISGPFNPVELINGLYSVILMGGDSRSITRVSELFKKKNLLCKTTDDRIGVELGNILVNPVSIYYGIASNLKKYGDNLAGLMVVEFLNEMRVLFKILGADESSMMDISTAGNLVSVVIGSGLSGKKFGIDFYNILKPSTKLTLFQRFINLLKRIFSSGNPFKQQFESQSYYVEGIYSLKSIIEFADKNNISLPLYKALYDVLIHKKSLKTLLKSLIKTTEKHQ